MPSRPPALAKPSKLRVNRVMVKSQLARGCDRVESKPRARETSGLVVKHISRETLSFALFPRGTLFAGIYRSSIRRTVVANILTKVSACGIINISAAIRQPSTQ